MKLSHTLSILALLVASAVAVAVPQDKSCTQCLTEDTFCSGFAGPVGTCCDGLVCENAPGVADNAHCIRKKKCLVKGATCVSIAGPQGTCCSGKCTFVAADYSVCK
ncbi:hypothetical protein BCIN_04g02570 [Botrytis cinerea B05.10]|uniref:Uncharacterized protein n=1 Tax=Botryotinia fuckeliana (strain B05.10) TaxID=332648 RepID=A0A384JF20_BOTFB|nr:hypothetical protein BCIN_04g02570 [Botrytis cinerea B05.10]ATZ49060.1 hypothetical protein BCIN_04g02570 [Botrytis cinerea B05.10]